MIITAAVPSSLPAASAGRVNRAPGNPPHSLYLPVLANNYEAPPPPTSFDLIDISLQKGKIHAETALVYKTFAEFDDARLPAEYRASEVGGNSTTYHWNLSPSALP